MLLEDEIRVVNSDSAPPQLFLRRRMPGVGIRGLGARAIFGSKRHGGGGGCGGEDCRVCASAGDVWVRMTGGEGEEFVGKIGGFSHESEHDLAVMVSDFLENGSGGAESWCSSDSDSGLSDLGLLAEKISYHKCAVNQYESDLLSMVHSILQSICDYDLLHIYDAPCNASCIRHSLVKLLRVAGYDAAVCLSKWQNCGKVPGGDHEYIDVAFENGIEGRERLIIDIDFRSHFEIARAVESYQTILKILPVVYVGSLARLKQLLQVMVEAAKSSLKQNSMPLPPWRSLAYLQAKWQSPYERMLVVDANRGARGQTADHKQCVGHLRRLKSSLQSEFEKERLLKPIVNENNHRMTFDKRRTSLFKI